MEPTLHPVMSELWTSKRGQRHHRGHLRYFLANPRLSGEVVVRPFVFGGQAINNERHLLKSQRAIKNSPKGQFPARHSRTRTGLFDTFFFKEALTHGCLDRRP